jgi:hypothetical protein
VYWDEIFLSEGASQAEVRQREVPLLSAALDFRGFSRTRIRSGTKTARYILLRQCFFGLVLESDAGAVHALWRRARAAARGGRPAVILGSGDEIRLRFSAALPPPPAGWTRDFLLKVDGWAKDRDPNTAFSTSVEPLPFHAMSRYPYPAGEHFPDDAEHRRYRREYNTRPALRLIRPLEGTN